jgi:hypothetical protein
VIPSVFEENSTEFHKKALRSYYKEVISNTVVYIITPDNTKDIAE